MHLRVRKKKQYSNLVLQKNIERAKYSNIKYKLVGNQTLKSNLQVTQTIILIAYTLDSMNFTTRQKKNYD